MTTLNNRPTQPLTGEELLLKVKELGDVSKPELVIACGYFSYNEDGTKNVHYTNFYKELLAAKGVEFIDTSQTILFGNFTLAQVGDWWDTNKPDITGFGDHKLNAVKYMAIKNLECLATVHRVISKHEDTDETQRDFWAQAASKLDDIVARVKGIMIGSDDGQYAPYEEAAADPYLSQISDESLEVLQHFGVEAPHLLNKYSCAVEDALIEQVKRNQELQAELAALKGEPTPGPTESEELKKAKAQLEAALRK